MRAALALPLVLAACSFPPDIPPHAAEGPMTLPPMDGRGRVVHRDPFDYMVSRLVTSHGFEFRVTRMARDFDYSEGAVAKSVAIDFCQEYHRGLSARAVAHFSQPNSWVFDGDCA